jgi:hypothetical protein
MSKKYVGKGNAYTWHLQRPIKYPVTQCFFYHKYDAQIKSYQYCKFQKKIFIKKILPNLTFQVKMGGN